MRLVLVILLGIIFISGCSGQQQATTLSEQTQQTGETKEFDIIAKQWGYDPSVIEVKLGDMVKLNIKSEDVTHGFTLSEFGIQETLKPGKTIEVEFSANKKGTFSFFCHIPCGKGHSGMNGKLVVK